MKIRLVVPTRELEENFYTHTALGRSLAICPRLLTGDHKVDVRLFGMNAKRALGAEIIGLPKLFNIAIREAADDPAILVFMHDDIRFVDFFWPQHVIDGLYRFDLIGLAGNTRRTHRQSAWGSIGEDRRLIDHKHFSGTVAHESEHGLRVNYFGPSYKEVKFLDGLFLACQSTMLLKHNIFFDERFEFHFYDMDLCRQFEVQNLIMGTWGVSVVHTDNHRYDTPEWHEGYQLYMEKWKW